MYRCIFNIINFLGVIPVVVMGVVDIGHLSGIEKYWGKVQNGANLNEEFEFILAEYLDDDE